MNECDNSKGAARLRQVAVLGLALSSLVLYGFTLSRGAFPGLPAKSLAWHMWLDSAPTLLDSLWGRLVRLCALLPGDSVAFWVGLSSAVFGAACVALVAILAMRVRYPLHDKYDPAETKREDQARILAGLMAGLFLAVSIPFWILSTRSLPGTFHLFMLLGAAFLISEFQRTGKSLYLYGLGLLYGLGISEFPTFLVFAPFAGLLVARAMLQRAEFSWPVLARTGFCMVPGLLFYVWNGWTLWSEPAVRLRGFGSMGSVVWYIWRDQWHLIANAPQTTGFLMVLALTAVPWGMLFLLRPKKPAWRYSPWQVLLRLVVLAAAMSTLFNAPLSPWRFFGMHYLMVTPYLILAGCAGYVVGDFWVMGQIREHRNAGIGQPLRSAMGVLGVSMLLASLVAGVLNMSTADGRSGATVEAMASEALDALEGRDVLIADGALDDSIRLLAKRRGINLHVITVPLTASRIYRDYLALSFNLPRQQALLQVGFGAFLQDFLSTDANLRRVAALDMPDLLREQGYLVPDRLVYRVELDEGAVDLPALIEKQRPFWNRLNAYESAALAENNPASGHQQHLLRMASKVANNLGFALIERGDVESAKTLFHQARKIYPDNISAMLNLLTIAQAAESPEVGVYLAEWETFKQRQVDSRVMWSLGTLYGYVHNTGFLVRNGMMWAVSGKPKMAEAEMRRATGDGTIDPAVKAFLGRAYLQDGDYGRSAEFYAEAVEDNPSDVQSLLMLVQLAIRAEDYTEAEQLLARAEKAGVRPERLRFERAVLSYLRGRPDAALASLKALVAQEKGDVRAWALLALMAANGQDNETFERAMKSLQGLRGDSPDIRLMLAELHIGRKDWVQARVELEQVVRMNPRLVRAWELLVDIDFYERKRELAEDHVRILLTLDPANYTGNLMLGSFQYARGQYALAESSYRTALLARREPAVMNDLAYLLLVKGGAMNEARTLIDEALALQPQNPVFLSTRSDLHLREGRLNESVADLQKVLAAMPNNASALLLTAEVYAARGQNKPALELAESLVERQGELPTEQQTRLQDLLRRLQ